MRTLIPLILLAFPFLEIFLLVKLAYLYGWWLLLYLVVIGYLGLQLIRGEKMLAPAKMMQSMASGGNPVKAMLGSARNMFAGVLLLIPGVISDVIAVILLLIPIQSQTAADGTATGQTAKDNNPYQKASNDDVIEGEFTHIREDLEHK
ncbi:MAG: FxsA family protein [Methylophilus sp.]|jgi:UPF0716 protein FxsA